jgi:sulfur-oxidizing protein SoxX
MRPSLYLIAVAAVVLALAGAYRALQPAERAAEASGAQAPPDERIIERAIRGSWSGTAPEWQARLAQDETQKACSRYRNVPPKPVADAILAREKGAIRYPPDGDFMGDWRKGEKIAQSGYGGRFTDDPPRAENGGNCYACHRLDARRVSFGTLGPSLSGYGRQRNYAASEVKAAYERIYNPQAFLPCAGMPRLGASGFLSIEQIKDVVAYLMSPDSPVNQRLDPSFRTERWEPKPALPRT